MIIVGLTGGISTGKSTVSAHLSGFPDVTVIDADITAREVVEPGKAALNKLVKCFGSGILLPDGTLDRPKLSSIVFHDDALRRKLNRIVQPYILRSMLWKITKAFLQVSNDIVLEYATMVYSPYLQKDIVALEEVQRRFTKQVFFRCFKDSETSYEESLKYLKIESLQLRRLYFDICYFYKIINGIVEMRLTNNVSLKPLATRSHSFRYTVDTAKRWKVAVLDVPLLFETRQNNLWYMHKTVVVWCNPEKQLERLMKRGNLSKDEALLQINSQLCIDDKLSLADVIIDNNELVEVTKEQVDKLYKSLINSSQITRNRLAVITIIFLVVFLIILLCGYIIYLIGNNL